MILLRTSYIGKQWCSRKYLGTGAVQNISISGVSRISFRGGFKFFFLKSGGICMHGAKQHAARGEATRLLGGFGGMLPRENF